uniref:Uncharacterized protein n=1 Tax=Oryza punctata TaxID=4537 RepID=A0A0E0L3C1_ORYPU
MFSLILSSWVLFGSTLATCAGVLPSFSAVETTTGCASTLPTAFTDAVPGEPNGEYACSDT